MNFIIEFLPKKACGALTIVVRAQNGFPLGVFDSTQEALVFIENKYHEIQMNTQSDVKVDA